MQEANSLTDMLTTDSFQRCQGGYNYLFFGGSGLNFILPSLCIRSYPPSSISRNLSFQKPTLVMHPLRRVSS